jgi:hypothetical protein
MSIRQDEAPLEGADHAGLETEETDWLVIVSEAYKTSTNYLDESYRKQFEKNVKNFQSKHPPGSKYHTDAYKMRSRLFRPKIRSGIRKAEGAFAEAAFATSEVISLSPVDQTDKGEDKKSEVWEAILNHRLTNSIPWYQVAVGAYQETKVYGVVFSRQDWQYEEKTTTQVWTDPITQVERQYKAPEVICDKPRIELLEIENVRFDPAAKWYDPINSSPYFIELMPMYVGDVLERMEAEADKTKQEKWRLYTRGEILQAGREIDLADSTRSSREKGGDPKDADKRTNEFEIVWVFRNFIRKDGQDYEFYTLTDKLMLTEPAKPSSPLGRPYRMGVSSIEAHRIIPASDVELSEDLQAEVNDVVNQRLDNVRIVLNKGKYVRREAETDLLTLKRSYPGRIVMTKDPDRDIKEEQVADVTASSYAEQDRLNNDFDDLVGGFSQGSVASNRKLNETVGGMKMLEQSGSQVVGYSVRTFVETWIQPVLKDVVTLIQHYESDELIQKYGAQAQIERPTRAGMQKDLNVNVSVGFGNLDPKAKVQALLQSLMALGQLVPWQMPQLDIETISREVFGVIGYRDGSKFFHEFATGPPEQPQDPMAGIKTAEMELKRQELEMNGQIAMARLEMEREVKMAELALKEKLTMEQLYSKLDLDMDKYHLDVAKEMGRREQISQQREEMRLKLATGSGI